MGAKAILGLSMYGIRVVTEIVYIYMYVVDPILSL